MAFGVYVHIPYCIQRCTYCDFATYEQTQIAPPEVYAEALKKELRRHVGFFKPQTLDTLYFGGGTPSLVPADIIISIQKELSNLGFPTGPETEITLEINPATVSEKKLNQYLENGFNRFSVGAQTFDDKLLKMVHREHNADQTKQTLALLRKYNLNFSFDILFALPTQTLGGVASDLEQAIELGASHISPYCLTVPEGHPLSKGRAPEDEQVDMFRVIKEHLEKIGMRQYEISNFSYPGKESRHNLLYWTDEEYWGVGLSAHSYSKSSPWGSRFWNQNNFQTYVNEFSKEAAAGLKSINELLPDSQVENLEKHQALTDFCHTSLRLSDGLNNDKALHKFGSIPSLDLRLAKLEKHGLIAKKPGGFQLTDKGILISNQVFEELTFLKQDLSE